MATSGLYGNTAATAVTLPTGSESSGLYGNNTVFGGTYFEWLIFKTAATAPATPTGGSWSFATNVGVPPTGWSSAPDTAPGSTIWISIALVNSRNTSALVWTAPSPISQTGTTGTAATIAVGTTTTGAAGSAATVTNSGTSSAAVFNFSVPQGIQGITGNTGATGNGITSITLTSGNHAPGTLDTYTIAYTTGSPSTFQVYNGANGTGTGTVTSVNLSGGTTGLTATGGPITLSGTITLGGLLAVANGGTGVTTSTGTGSVVLSTSPTLVTPALGTPSALVGTNITGTASGLTAGNVTTNANLTGAVTSVGNATSLGSFTSAQLAAALTDETGTGSSVFATSPTLVTPTLSGAVVGNSAPYLNFNSTTAPSYNSGRFWYDSTQDSLSFNNVVTNNTIHIGQEIQLRVLNSTGSTIAAGAPVYVTSSASGQVYPNVALAKADSLSTSVVIGMANQAIPTGTVGYVTTAGVVAGLSTGTYSTGDTLYLSPYSAGQVMNTIPPTGYPIKVGVVSYANSPNGQIYINQQNAFVQAANVVGTLAVANGGTGVTTSTGTGSVVLSISPTLVTPALGTPSALVGTNITGTASSLSIGGNAATATTATNVSGGTSSVTSETVSGNLTLSGGTANGVAYLNGSKVLTTGSALTFDGTNFATTGTVTANGRSKFIGASEPFAVYLRYNGSTNGVYLGSSAVDTLNAYDSAGNPFLQFSSAADIFYVAGSEQMRLTSTGLGIGTSSPIVKFQVRDGANYNFWVRQNSSALQIAAATDAYALTVPMAFSAGSYSWAVNNGTNALNLDSAGNLGLGVTPSVWTAYKGMQISTVSSLVGSGGSTDLGMNWYYATGDKYLTTGPASRLTQYNGGFQWFNAPSGTAGNAITFTQAMTLGSDGTLGVGTTTAVAADGTLVAAGSSGTGQGAANTVAQINIWETTSGNKAGLWFGAMTNSNVGVIGSRTASGAIAFQTYNGGWAERARIDSSGNLGLGVTPSAWGSFSGILQNVDTVALSGLGLTRNMYYNAGYKYIGTGNAVRYGNDSGQHAWYNAPSGTAGNAITFTQAMTLDASGNLGVGTTSPVARADIISNTTYQLHLATTTGNYSSGGLYLGALGTSDPNYYGYLSWDQASETTRLAARSPSSTGGIAFYVGTSGTPTERARIDSSGNLALGATSSNGMRFYAFGYSPELYDPTTYSAKYAYYTKGSQESFEISTGSTLKAGYANLINIGVNDNNGGDQVYYGAVAQSNANAGANFVFGRRTGAQAWAESARIDSSGNLLVGTTSSTAPNPGFSVYAAGAGNTQVIIGHSTSSGSGQGYAVFAYNGSTIGSITQSGTTAVLFNVTSDQRLKENIVDAPEFGSVIDSIKVRSYDWKTDHTHQRAGFIAQELVTVAPEAVHQPADPEEMMAVDYSKLVPMLVKEIQSLRQRLAALEAK